MPLVFSPPSIEERYEIPGRHGFAHVTAPVRVGISLLRIGGVYRQVRQPVEWEIAQADRYYRGGYVYALTESEFAELVAAGYGDHITPHPRGPLYPDTDTHPEWSTFTV